METDPTRMCALLVGLLPQAMYAQAKPETPDKAIKADRALDTEPAQWMRFSAGEDRGDSDANGVPDLLADRQPRRPTRDESANRPHPRGGGRTSAVRRRGQSP